MDRREFLTGAAAFAATAGSAEAGFNGRSLALLGGAGGLALPSVFLQMGDSTAAQGANPPNNGSTYGWTNVGVMEWLRMQTANRVSCPVANNIGVSGSYIDQARTDQVPLISGLSALPSDIVLKTGTNNLAGGDALATMQSQYTSLLQAILALSFVQRIWMVPITPRTTGMNATLYQRRKDFNTWQASLVSTPSVALALGISARNQTKLRALDAAFMTEADGDTPTTGYVVADGLHHTPRTTQGLASQIASYVNGAVAAPTIRRPTASDLWSVGNPGGTLLRNGGVNRGLLDGTSGSKPLSTGITATGDVATQWRVQRDVGTAPGTLVCSKEATDGSGRSGQIITYTTSDVGSLGEIISLFYLGAAFGIAAADGITSGVPLTAVAEIEILQNTGALGGIHLRWSGNGTGIGNARGDFIYSSSQPAGQFPSGALGPYWLQLGNPITPVSNTTSLQGGISVAIDATGGPLTLSFAIRDLGVWAA